MPTSNICFLSNLKVNLLQKIIGRTINGWNMNRHMFNSNLGMISPKAWVQIALPESQSTETTAIQTPIM